MNPQGNPYTTPRAGVDSVEAPLEIAPAGRWRRFGSYLIDSVAFSLLGGVVGGILGAVGITFEGVSSFVFSSLLMLVYYIGLEGSSGRTLGKLLLGMRVVNEAGGQPTFGQIIGRTFARLITFEALAIFGDQRRTLHDSLPGTYVVMSR
jgi:uncharacterized RDD family membrane protein YckC